ncbi:MAG: hypothetical protein A2W25_08715 [candidate division Zixibacteria bacterium RBG_16_53_22]|nr:MAG: hypothetical protein A2W25_08715 [candidate division Zixibacteria bacterium RBG_16_53_22]
MWNLEAESEKKTSHSTATQWNLVFQYATIALSLISGFILFPLNLRFIPIGLFGAWLASGNILLWLTIFEPGIGEIIQQRIAVAFGARDTNSLTNLISLNITVSLIIGSCFIIAGLTAASFIPSWLDVTSPNDAKQLEKAFAISVVGTGLLLCGYGIAGGNLALMRTLSQGIVNTLAGIASLFVQIFLLFTGFGLLAIAYGIVARALILFAGNGLILWRAMRAEEVPVSLSFRVSRGMFKDLSFTAVARISNIIANNLDSIVVSKVLGNELVPVLRATRSPLDMSRWILERPAYALSPALSSLKGKNHMERVRFQLLRLARFVIWGVVGFAVLFWMFNKDIIRLWVGEGLFAGHTVNLLLCALFIVAVVTLNLKYVCLALGDVRAKNIMEFSQALSILPLVVLGGLYFGLPGVILAAILSNIWIAGWYMPRSFSRLVSLTIKDKLSIYKEMVNAFLAALFAATTVFWFNPRSVFQIALVIVTFTTCFIFFLSILSLHLRTELLDIKKRFYSIACGT